MFLNCGFHIFVHVDKRTGRKVLVLIEQRERSPLLREVHRGQIGRPRNPLQDRTGPRRRILGPVAQTDHQERVRETRDPQPDAPFGRRLLCLRVEREPRRIHHVVHHPHGGCDKIVQSGIVERGVRPERVGHKLREVHRPQEAGTIGWQGLLATGVCGGNRLHIGEVVHRVDAVDEDHTGFGIIVSRAHDRIPE